jgi:hypothetical protein
MRTPVPQAGVPPEQPADRSAHTRLLTDLLDAAAGERLELHWNSPQTQLAQSSQS